jgi:hypothetical protein
MSEITLESVFETLEKFLEQDELPEALVCVMAPDLAQKFRTEMGFPEGSTMTGIYTMPVIVTDLLRPGTFRVIPRTAIDALFGALPG